VCNTVSSRRSHCHMHGRARLEKPFKVSLSQLSRRSTYMNRCTRVVNTHTHHIRTHIHISCAHLFASRLLALVCSISPDTCRPAYGLPWEPGKKMRRHRVCITPNEVSTRKRPSAAIPICSYMHLHCTSSDIIIHKRLSAATPAQLYLCYCTK